MNEPLISVILPYFNAENTLLKAAESILNQSFTSLELILVNNASVDASRKIAHQLSQKDQRIVCLDEPTKGVSYAFNKGLKKSKGLLIARMDADDVSHPTRLQRQLDTFKQNPQLGIVATQVSIPNGINNEGFQTYVAWSNSLLSIESIYLNRFVEQPVINPTILCKKEVFDDCGSYQQGDFPEDYDWFLRVLEKYSIVKIAEPLLTWQDLPSRLSRNDSRYSSEAFFKTKAKYLSKWLLEKNKLDIPIAIWGYGKKAKKRIQHLTSFGVKIEVFIDVKPKNPYQTNYLFYKDIPPPGRYFIISYVGNRGAREEIRSFLQKKRYQEGIHFLIAA